eukprot:769876-Lingulodinium_polyedra.AAC.1
MGRQFEDLGEPRTARSGKQLQATTRLTITSLFLRGHRDLAAAQHQRTVGQPLLSPLRNTLFKRR